MLAFFMIEEESNTEQMNPPSFHYGPQGSASGQARNKQGNVRTHINHKNLSQ